MAGNQPCAPFERQIIPEPGESDDYSIAETDQKVNVRNAPEQPRSEAGQANAAEFRYGELASNRCKGTKVTIPKRPLGLSAAAR